MHRIRVKNRFATGKRKSFDIPVKPDLAVTPSQMARMAANGVAISSQIASNFNDGEVNPSFEVPLSQIRGLDIVDYWEAQKEARFNVKKHIKANEDKFGDSTISKN